MGLFNTLRYIIDHPLNQGAKPQAVLRFASWQIRSRLSAGPHIVPWVGDARLAVTRGMTGATGNIYAGLHEFAEMAFVLHTLRASDLFVDVGANVGSYSVLAAKCAGAHVIAFEPSPAACASLERNISLNEIGSLVEVHRIAVGSRSGTVSFTAGWDTGNHVVSDGDRSVESSTVEMKTLDEVLAGRRPAVIKIDVEGFETDVLAGAAATLRDHGVLAVIMELNGAGSRYGYNDSDLHRTMLSIGFHPVSYDPFTRALRPENSHGVVGNTIYVAADDIVAERVRTSRRFRVLDRDI